jgi:hypothetical protein
MSDKRILYRKKLPGDTLYDFCPFCVKQKKEAGQDYHTLPPLFEFKTAEWDQILQHEYISDAQWECPACKKIITMQTYLDFYSEPYQR